MTSEQTPDTPDTPSYCLRFEKDTKYTLQKKIDITSQQTSFEIGFASYYIMWLSRLFFFVLVGVCLLALNPTMAADAAAKQKKRPFGYCFYSALGLSKGASSQEIEEAYDELVGEYPGNAEDEEDQDTHAKIVEAYKVLKLKYTKDIYDNHGMKGYERWERGEEPAAGGKPKVSATINPDGTVNIPKETENKDKDKDKDVAEKEDLSISLWGDDARPKGYCFYAALQLHKKAKDEHIEAAYKRLAEKYSVSSTGQSQLIYKKITEAHQILSDPGLKEVYDKYGMKGFEAWEMGKTPEYTQEQNSAMWGLLKWHAKEKGLDLEDLNFEEIDDDKEEEYATEYDAPTPPQVDLDADSYGTI